MFLKGVLNTVVELVPLQYYSSNQIVPSASWKGVGPKLSIYFQLVIQKVSVCSRPHLPYLQAV